MRADLPGKERLRIVSKTGTVALPQLIAFGLLAAIVIIAILVPAGAAAGVSMYLIGYVLGLGNRKAVKGRSHETVDRLLRRY